MSSVLKEKSKQKTPASFPVRRMDYEFQDMPKYWCNNEPTFTHYFTGLSTLFPEGESYFVRSVRALRAEVKNNEQLDRDIGAFIGQEAMHSKEHHAFHQSAQQYGLDPESLEKMTGIVLKAIERTFPKKWNLLVTVGLEHYTAVLVVEMMKDVNELMTDETIRNLWLWHSVEETEHKAVAYDMYEYLYGKGLDAYIPRIAIFTFSLAMITVMSTLYQVVLLKRDRQLFNLNSWRKFMHHGREKYKVFIPKFLDYYRFDFHPNDTDESEIVAQTKIKIGLSPEQSTFIH
ncbi:MULTISPECIES: metal-dependent hydrolase [Acinetobacter]|uniref:Metal-dependent hydrolase n=1 Tax=Acinetobacter suaedae TaxID=2609668 RepID=A0A5P1UU12_9GAMM|nr:MULTISPECIES: metal-dependent hydrolase [Acinetobacter]AZN66946.1 metal-dependent hydrolase [Acinetobacter haemolyticus]MCU4378437.1 metal-dependent hydrolase [Acinetobacter haemolyticus]MEB6676201.1 metal-dependent hydrolase [Acinetobacter haemolyticus]MQZ29903.1 metal-dependent hydrolase [Acinetobacter haemolyticus]QER40215.1 metal-dependent hydrolase [Acinetobacter sp. C16S1]